MATSRMSDKEIDDLLRDALDDSSSKPNNSRGSNVSVVDFGKAHPEPEEPAIAAMIRGMKKKTVAANRAEERDRVFSGDLGMKALGIRYLLNIVSAKRGMVSNSCCWEYVDELLTRYELTQLYDHFLPPKQRKEIKERERTPPEYSDNDGTDEILNYLYLRPESHSHFLAGFKLLLEYRAKEFMAELRKPGRQSLLLRNLKMLRRQFHLSRNEMELVQFLHLWRRGVVRMGELYSDNNGRQKIDVLAMGSGLALKDLRVVLADEGKLIRHNIIDKDDLEISWRFQSFLSEESSVVPMDGLSGMGRQEYAHLQRENHRRVFSGEMRLKAQAARFFRNVVAATREPITDCGWWSFVERVFTRQDVQALYDQVLPSSIRRSLAAGYGRTPPELSRNDEASEIMQYLDGQPLLRPRFKRELLAALDARIADFDDLLQRRKATALQRKLEEMRKLFDLTDCEYQAVLFLYMLNNHMLDISGFREFSRTSNKLHVMSLALGVSEAAIYKIMSPHCGLFRFGICNASLDLDSCFINYLDGSSAIPLSERFFKKFRDEALPWEMHGKLAESEGGVIVEAIAAKGARRGMNVLLYGEAGTGKTSFAQSIAAKTGRELYMISMADSNGAYSTSFRFAAIEVAKKRLDPDKVILCIDECDNMLADTMAGKGRLNLSGEDDSPNESASSSGNSKGMINSLLDDSRFVIIWIANTLRRHIDPSCRRRFDYNVYFDALTDCARRFIWRNSLKRHGVTREVPEAFLEMLSERFPVNAGGIDVAVRNAWDICRHNPKADFPGEITKFLRAHCDIMEISEVPAQTRTVTNYGLEGLNIKSGLALPRLVGACRNFLKRNLSVAAQGDSPPLNILLTGAPGTGKTEFVKYLAKQLDKKLTIAMANDFLDSYVGETEHNIVKLFRDAAMDNTLLFLDEDDAMLRSRDYATRSWEVT